MVLSRARSWTRIWLGTAVLGAAIAAGVATTATAAEPPEVAALALPGPRAFVSGLDLECFTTPGPSLDVAVRLTHLNPVLRALGLPQHAVVIRELVQTCVPVAKNGVPPPPAAAPFIQHVDLACYRVEGPALATPTTLTLRHLNPVLANLPIHTVTMLQPVQLCLPVAKNGVALPPDVQRLVELIDLECYALQAGAHPTFGVNLRQLNPQLGNIPPHPMTLIPLRRQLCVPVQKGQQPIPPDILAIIQWIDLEKFVASPLVNLPPVNVVLHHLNPLFTTLPRVPVVLQQASALMVPVAKNNAVPPPP